MLSMAKMMENTEKWDVCQVMESSVVYTACSINCQHTGFHCMTKFRPAEKRQHSKVRHTRQANGVNPVIPKQDTNPRDMTGGAFPFHQPLCGVQLWMEGRTSWSDFDFVSRLVKVVSIADISNGWCLALLCNMHLKIFLNNSDWMFLKLLWK